MKVLRVGLTLSLVFAVALFAAGCENQGKTQGQRKVDTLTAAINNFAISLNNAKGEIETTLTAYKNVVYNQDGDLQTPFNAFNNGLTRIESRVVEVRNRWGTVERGIEPFFAQWEDDLQKFNSEDMKRRSRERLAATRAKFAEIDKVGARARKAYERLMATWKDHRLFLANDLNMGAAKSLQKDATQIQDDIDTLYETIDQLISAAEAYNDAVSARTAGG